MTYAWYDIFGTLGVVLIIVTYALLQLGRIRSDHLAYSVMNGVGALLILVSLVYSFNFPSFVVEFFWLVISLYGIARSFISK